jgi:mannonate dehydratase
MRLSPVLTPRSPTNLRWAAQCGVTDLVHRYPGEKLEDLVQARRHAAEYGLSLSVIEGYLPLERIKQGCDDGTELAALKQLIRNMGQAEVPILCYNFMAGTDWVRTRLNIPERGGALVTGFSLQDVQQAILLGHDSGHSDYQRDEQIVTASQLWQRLERLLSEVVPVAEKAGVTLTMHPDDPPLPELLGKARIMNSVENFLRLVELVPSRHNAICFCQGNFVAMGADIPDAVRRLGPHIRYVHFRDVRGTAEAFVETFHDNGPTDMVAAMSALQAVGFDGPLRPDHVPQLAGEEDGEPGYTMLGRLFAYGYIRGLMQATSRSPAGAPLGGP